MLDFLQKIDRQQIWPVLCSVRRGAPTARQINGRTYWYDRYRIESAIPETYLAEETPDLQARLERYEALKEESAGRRRERARLVRLFRGERFLGLDGASGSLISALAKAATFRLGAYSSERRLSGSMKASLGSVSAWTRPP